MLKKRIISCPCCNRLLNVTKLQAGTKIRCRKCQTLNTVPQFDDYSDHFPVYHGNIKQIQRPGKRLVPSLREPEPRPVASIRARQKISSVEGRPLDFLLGAGFAIALIMLVIAFLLKFIL